MNEEIIKEQEIEEQEDGKFKYKVIIIILIIIILLLGFVLYALYRKNKDYSNKFNRDGIKIGNKEIFDIKCDDNCSCSLDEEAEDDEDDEEDADEDETGTGGTASTTTKKKRRNTYTYKLDVEDREIVWDKVNQINIFENPLYETNKLIAPTSTNSYAFSIRNKTKFPVNYIVDFIEENPAYINMKYRLKKNGRYISGSSTEWVTADELAIDTKDFASGDTEEFILDWKWFESANDTAIGATRPNYKIHINIMAEQKV